MKWNPFTSAFAATAYIGGVVLLIHLMESKRHDTPDTYLDGIGFISLLVFSAAVMAFIFFYQPILTLIEGKRQEAVTYFLQTLAIFGTITVLLLTFVSLQ